MTGQAPTGGGRSGRVPLGCLLAVVLAAGGCVAYAEVKGDVPGGAPSPGAVSASAGASGPAVAAAVGPGDNPAFDQAGDGPDCSMTYGSGPDGNVLTVFALGAPGTLVTHVDGPGGQHIRTQAVPKGTVSFGYGFPLDQASGMGAIFYPASGPREQCAIGPAR